LPGILLVVRVASGQAAPTQPQSLQALVAEIHQLRQELRASTVTAQRTQIVLYRLQAEEAAVTRATQRLDQARDRAIAAEDRRKRDAADIERVEAAQEHAQEPERKQGEELLPQLKAALESSRAAEQQAQSRQAEAESQLEVEQAKLTALQEQLDRLDRSLAGSEQPATGRQ
jgi:chromosome segregation ATPase